MRLRSVKKRNVDMGDTEIIHTTELEAQSLEHLGAPRQL